MRLPALVVVLALTQAQASAAVPAVRAGSDIAGTRVVAQTVLPPSPETYALDDCDARQEAHLTKIGQQVAKAGWIVTSEASLGPYRVVTFASGFEGRCNPRNTRIGVFKGSSLVALVYTPKGDSKWSNLGVGAVEPMEGGALRVWRGDAAAPPIGELHADRWGIRLTRLASQQSFCNGRVVLPNIFGKTIRRARALLIARGWRPIRHKIDPNGEDPEVMNLIYDGVFEVDYCYGDLIDACEFHYRNRRGILTIATSGYKENLPRYPVQDYGVGCSVSSRPPEKYCTDKGHLCRWTQGPAPPLR